MLTLAKITNEAYKIRWDHSGDPIPPISYLVSARNDTAAFQIVLQSNYQYSVCTRPVEYFSRKAGIRGYHERIRIAVSAPFNVELNLEDMMIDHDDIKKADVLLKQDVLECPANLPSGVWAEIKVPSDAAPGIYTVNVKVFTSGYGDDESLAFEQDIPLTVAEYVLPDAKDWSIYVNLWQHVSTLAVYHDVPLWSDEHFDVIEKYIDAISALGQRSITICAGNIPWGGWGCNNSYEHFANLYQYSIIGITKKADGTFFYDYSKMQRYIDICTKAGMTGDIEIFGIVNVWQKNAVRNLCEDYPEKNIVLRYMDETDGKLKYIRDRENVIAYVKALEQYFIRTGQIERVRIGADEPGDVERYRESLNLINEIAPSFKCSAAIYHSDFVEIFKDNIETMSPSIGTACREYRQLAEHKAEFPHKKLLWYVCGHSGFPNNCIINPLADNRAIGLLNDILGFDGILRWNFCLYTEDPRKDIRFSPIGAGDINFVYPSKNGSLLLSLRYKNLQRGLSDYELIHALREKDPDCADKLMASICNFPIKDLAQFNTLRGKIGGNPDQNRHLAVMSRNWDDYNNLKAKVLQLL